MLYSGTYICVVTGETYTCSDLGNICMLYSGTYICVVTGETYTCSDLGDIYGGGWLSCLRCETLPPRSGFTRFQSPVKEKKGMSRSSTMK